MSPRDDRHTSCPGCGHEIELTLAAILQCERLGVSCDCPQCGHEWIFQADQLKESNKWAGRQLAAADHRGNTTSTVYVVDDDPASRSSLKSYLEAEGLYVEVYSTAEDFLHEFDLSHRGCLILEWDMPGLGGQELQQRIRGAGSRLPVIFLSRIGDIETVVRSYQNGAFDYYEKPFEPQPLLSRIQDALREDSRLRAISNLQVSRTISNSNSNESDEYQDVEYAMQQRPLMIGTPAT